MTWLDRGNCPSQRLSSVPLFAGTGSATGPTPSLKLGSGGTSSFRRCDWTLQHV